MSSSLEDARRKAPLIREATSLVSQRQAPLSLRETNAVLEDLVKEHRDTGKKLLALGAALLVVPDPFTDAAAVPVLIAGKVLQTRQAISVKEVYNEMRQTFNQLSSACCF